MRRSSSTWRRTFDVDVDFDVGRRAQSRLKREGIVTELPDGTLQTLAPEQAALHIDELWDACLNELPDIVAGGGPGGRDGKRRRTTSMTRVAGHVCSENSTAKLTGQRPSGGSI